MNWGCVGGVGGWDGVRMWGLFLVLVVDVVLDVVWEYFVDCCLFVFGGDEVVEFVFVVGFWNFFGWVGFYVEM